MRKSKMAAIAVVTGLLLAPLASFAHSYVSVGLSFGYPVSRYDYGGPTVIYAASPVFYAPDDYYDDDESAPRADYYEEPTADYRDDSNGYQERNQGDYGRRSNRHNEGNHDDTDNQDD